MIDDETFEEVPPFVLGALGGLTPVNEEVERVARGLVDTSFEEGGMSASMQTLVFHRLDLINRSPVTRILVRLAREANIPYGEARERWTDEDIAFEIAASAIEQAEHLRRCPSCGTDPHDYQDPKSKRMLRNPRVGLDMWDCFMCQEIAKHRRMLDDASKERGVDIRVMPRVEGERFFRGGDIADS